MNTFYTLGLAHMMGGVDRIRPLAVFSSIERAREFEQSCRADQPYWDDEAQDDYGQFHKYHKTYKKGSPLEWFNPPDSFGGLREDQVPVSLADFAQILGVPADPTVSTPSPSV